MKLKYTKGRASEQDIYAHLVQCNESFIPRLEERVDIQEYSKKIAEKAVTFEAWSGDSLAGLVAAYFNEPKGQIGYITSVSIMKDYMGMGVASTLVDLSIDYAREHGFETIMLEVAKGNEHAVQLYRRLLFREFEDKGATIFMKLDV